MRLMSALLLTVLAAPLPASAQDYAAQYDAIMMDMHMAMGGGSTGDPDVDFAAGMIPHHEAAVAMAELLLEHGEDPELRAMAEAIIETQTAEIEMLQAWLEENAPEN